MVNRGNYVLVQEYLDYRRRVRRVTERSIQISWTYAKHVLLWLDETPLRKAAQKERTFAQHVAEHEQRRGRALSAEAMRKCHQELRMLFGYLKTAHAADFRSLPAEWIDSHRPPRPVEMAPPARSYVSMDEALALARCAPGECDEVMLRDRAAAAMLFLSGARADAFCTLPIAAVDLERRVIRQWPSLGVRTKNGKSATTHLLDVPELLAVAQAWDELVRARLPATSAWFAHFKSRLGDVDLVDARVGRYRTTGLDRRLRVLFARAGLAYRSAHKFRHGHAMYALERARDMADYKAISMNLMHDDIRTTDGIYARPTNEQVGARIAGLGPGRGAETDAELAVLLLRAARKLGGKWGALRSGLGLP